MKQLNQYCPEIVTICPSSAFGEIISTGPKTTSSMILKLMTGKVSAIPPMKFTCADVRDIALAHLRATEKPDAANKRFIISFVGGYTFQELANFV